MEGVKLLLLEEVRRVMCFRIKALNVPWYQKQRPVTGWEGNGRAIMALSKRNGTGPGPDFEGLGKIRLV